jgi:ABC-type transport system involved in multi-copper enzyme maturation permease subunit
MSISAPRYVATAVQHLDRAYRTLAIFRREFIRRAGWGTVLLVTLTFLIVTLIVGLNTNFAAEIGQLTLATYESPFSSPVWALLILIVATAVGAGSIADDIGSRSIVLYLSRPIHLADYLVAKAGAVGSWILIAAVGPGLLAVGLVASLGIGSDTTNLSAAAGFAVTGILAAIFFTGLALALSALTDRALYAGVGIFGVVLSLDIGADVVSAITQNTNVFYASPISDLSTVAAAVFDVEGPYPTYPLTSAVLLVVGGVLLAAVAYWRLSRIEVVGE